MVGGATRARTQVAADQVQLGRRPAAAGEPPQRGDQRCEVRGRGAGPGQGEVRAVGPVRRRAGRSGARGPHRVDQPGQGRPVPVDPGPQHRVPNRPAPVSASSAGGWRRAARASRSASCSRVRSSTSARKASVTCHCSGRVQRSPAGVGSPCTAAASSARASGGGTRATNIRIGPSSRPGCRSGRSVRRDRRPPAGRPDGRDAAAVRGYLQRAEALGFTGCWVSEQVVGTAPVLSPLEVLAVAAGCTERVRARAPPALISTVRSPLHLARLGGHPRPPQRRAGRAGRGHRRARRPFPAYGATAAGYLQRFEEGTR